MPMTGRAKLEAIKLKHLPKGSDAWATCGDKTLLEITRAKLLRYLCSMEGTKREYRDKDEYWYHGEVDPDDVEDAVLYLSCLLERG